MKLNKQWDEQDHDAHLIVVETPFKDENGDTVYWSINCGVYWGCRSCSDEFLVNEVPHPEDGLCLDCRLVLCQEDAGLS